MEIVGLPAAVGNRVLVELDAAELRGRVAEAVLVAAPVEAGHAPHRPVDSCAVEAVGAGIDHGVADAGGAVACRGVPGGEHGVARRRAARGPRRIERVAAQHRARDARAVDLAVVEVAGEGASPRPTLPCGGPQKIRICCCRRDAEPPARVAGALERHDLGEVVAVAVLDRLLVERGLAARRVVRGRHQVPLARDERDVGRDRVRGRAVARAECQRAGLVDLERVAAAVGLLPAG